MNRFGFAVVGGRVAPAPAEQMGLQPDMGDPHLVSKQRGACWSPVFPSTFIVLYCLT